MGCMGISSTGSQVPIHFLAAIQVPENCPDYQKYYRHMRKVRMGRPPTPKAQLCSL